LVVLNLELLMSISEPLSVRRSREGGVVRLTPVGELDLATVPLLERACDEVLGDETAEMIVVDLTELGFMDSTGLHLLLRTAEACRDADRLRVVNGSSAVVRVLDVSGVRGLLPIISSNSDPRAPLG
jgi:anti-anti-sigma factor